MEKSGQRQKIMDHVTRLQADAEGVRVSTLFEPPQLVAGAQVKEIDFLEGLVTLTITAGKE